MDGDPAIRWQVLRDLYDAPKDVWSNERQRTITHGWGRQLIGAMDADGNWPVGRWSGTVWTLLIAMDCGLPPEYPSLQNAAHSFIRKNLSHESRNRGDWLIKKVDLCHVGFWLRIGAYFLEPNETLQCLVDSLLSVQLPDGGWNCRVRSSLNVHHSSFHTTLNVLDGLSEAVSAGILDENSFRAIESCALEFILRHQMYRSDRTGEIIDQRFTHLTYPSFWHYNVLRGLDYLRNRPEIGDSRLNHPVALLKIQQSSNGRWKVEKRVPGATLFDMERFGGDSRWNTLKALRILRQREAYSSGVR